jgi:hypothetical protein
MSHDYTDLIARLRSYISPSWGSALPDLHEAADTIAALVAECERLQIVHQDHAAELGAERDAAVADAQRYRWMCSERLGWFSRMAPLPWKQQTMKDALDAAIDTALSKGDK